MCVTSSMGPKECRWSFRCLANFDAEVLFWKERLCSLYLEVKPLLV